MRPTSEPRMDHDDRKVYRRDDLVLAHVQRTGHVDFLAVAVDGQGNVADNILRVQLVVEDLLYKGEHTHLFRYLTTVAALAVGIRYCFLLCCARCHDQQGTHKDACFLKMVYIHISFCFIFLSDIYEL